MRKLIRKFTRSKECAKINPIEIIGNRYHEKVSKVKLILKCDFECFKNWFLAREN